MAVMYKFERQDKQPTQPSRQPWEPGSTPTQGGSFHQQGSRDRLQRASQAVPAGLEKSSPAGAAGPASTRIASCACRAGEVFTSRGRGTGFNAHRKLCLSGWRSLHQQGPQDRLQRASQAVPVGLEKSSPAGAAGPASTRIASCACRAGEVFTSRGRGTGFAGPQAQRPPRGAGRYTQ
jgi:hypothetical protein